MSQLVDIHQHGNELRIAARIPSLSYLNNVMRCNCFPELWDLYRHAHSPAKEFTESYSALAKFRRYQRSALEYDVLHVGDGAHARTGAMFAFMTKNTYNMSIDPATNAPLIKAWENRYAVKRFAWDNVRAEDYVGECLGDVNPIFVTFVHAHVDTDHILSLMPNWQGAFVMACCKPSAQLSKKYRVIDEGQDWNVLSPQRQYQVLVNEPVRELDRAGGAS